MKEDKRRHERQAIKGLINLKFYSWRTSDTISDKAEIVIGMVNNVSKSGLGIRAFNQVDVGIPVTIRRLILGEEEYDNDLLATVVWQRAEGSCYNIGISFEKEIDLDI